MSDEALTIIKGKTFRRVIRWAHPTTLVYKAISAITKAGGAVVTAASHGIPDGWPVAVVSAGGMRQINAKNWPLRLSDFTPATVLSSSSVSLNAVNSTDYDTYTSGGYLVYRLPMSLASAEARFQIRETETSEDALVELDETAGIEIDDTTKTITITLAAGDTEDYEFYSGVAELEVETSDGDVTQLLKRDVVVEDEVARV